MPSIVFGELFYGAFNSTEVDQNLARIDALAGDAVCIPCDDSTARIYGEIKATLRQKGRPLPENDIWIAAVAVQHSLTVVTRDDHFQEIEGLPLVRW